MLQLSQKKKKDQSRPLQIQADHQDICSDISREHVQPNLQHSEVTHGCEQGGRVVVAYGTSCCLLPYLPPPSLPTSPSASVSSDFSQVRSAFSLTSKLPSALLSLLLSPQTRPLLSSVLPVLFFFFKKEAVLFKL